MGQLLSVDLIVIGSVNKLAKFTITLKFIDVRKGNVEYADSEIAQVEEAIEQAINTLAERSAKIILNTPPPKPPVTTPSPNLTGYYLRGLFGDWHSLVL